MEESLCERGIGAKTKRALEDPEVEREIEHIKTDPLKHIPVRIIETDYHCMACGF